MVEEVSGIGDMEKSVLGVEKVEGGETVGDETVGDNTEVIETGPEKDQENATIAEDLFDTTTVDEDLLDATTADQMEAENTGFCRQAETFSSAQDDLGDEAEEEYVNDDEATDGPKKKTQKKTKYDLADDPDDPFGEPSIAGLESLAAQGGQRKDNRRYKTVLKKFIEQCEKDAEKGLGPELGATKEEIIGHNVTEKRLDELLARFMATRFNVKKYLQEVWRGEQARPQHNKNKEPS